MKKILSLLVIAATLLAADPEPIDTNVTTSTTNHSEHGPLFTAAVIIGVPIVIVGGVVYYVVLAPIALTFWAFGIEPSEKKVQ